MSEVLPADYARTRNALDGAVTRLSPYLTHGLATLPEVLQAALAREGFDVQHKLVFELGWREYFRHVWQVQGDGIFQSLHEGVLLEQAYSPELPADIRLARTGLPVIDQAVRTLYATGYLHNHARMWLASYVVHLRKVHWRAGADWMVSHLLDGDLASNHLSWQWVAGTGSTKPYLFNAANVARFAPSDWHCEGTVLDISYEALDAIARSTRVLSPEPQAEGVAEPTLSTRPPAATAPDAPDALQVQGRDVWLVHPWALGEPPADLPSGCLCIGWWPAEHHDAWPWSEARWSFAGTRMAALTPVRWHGTRQQLAQALAGARSVQTLTDPHVSALLPAQVEQRAQHRLFGEVPYACTSFSKWWTRSTRGVKTPGDLPGMSGQPALT